MSPLLKILLSVKNETREKWNGVKMERIFLKWPVFTQENCFLLIITWLFLAHFVEKKRAIAGVYPSVRPHSRLSQFL